MEYYVARPADYWIAQNAISITRNALGDANRIQGSVASGAVIMCFIEAVKPASQGGDPENGDGLYYGADHEPKRWPLSLSPTYFNSNTKKYVYAAIPRSTSIGTQAVVVFPSIELDIYGRSREASVDPDTGKPVVDPDSGEPVYTYTQVGSTDYFYIFLQGILTSSGDLGNVPREWEQEIAFGELETAQGRENRQNSSEWYVYSQINETVTFLRKIVMSATAWFHNIRLGSDKKELTGVATAATSDEYADSEKLVVTPSYLNGKYLSKTHDDVAYGNITFKKDVTVEGKLTAAELISNFLHTSDFQNNKELGGLLGLGFGVTTDPSGKATVQTDNLIVLGKMFVNSLNIREVTYIGGVYLLTPAGSTVERVQELYAEGGESYGDTRTWVTDGTGLVVGYRVLWKADDGTTSTMNYWHQGDQAFCEIFNIGKAGHYDNFSNRRYWRLVCRTGHTTVDGKEYNYADLSDYPYVLLYDIDGNPIRSESGEGSDYFIGYEGAEYGVNDNDVPDAGDKVVCLGSQADKDRQAAIQISAEGVASFGIYDGINDYKPLTDYEIHFMSKDFVRMRSSKFEWTTDTGVHKPPTVYLGDWVEGNISYWGIEWTYQGHNWLCIMPRNAVDPDSQNVETGQTRQAPGTNPAWWVDNKGDSGKTYALGFYTDGEDPTPIVGLAVRPASVDEKVVPYLLYGQDDISGSVYSWLWERESNYKNLDEAWGNEDVPLADLPSKYDPESPDYDPMLVRPKRKNYRMLHITTDDLPAGWDAAGGKVGFKCTATFNASGEQAQIINRISIV